MAKSMQQHIHFIKLTDHRGEVMYVNSIYIQAVLKLDDEDYTRIMIANNQYSVQESLEYIMDWINDDV